MTSNQPETIYCVVDNRVLVLGIDAIYREYMKEFESAFLLPLVEVIAAKLDVSEANVPVEGYYSELESLTRYFKLMRALQKESESAKHLVNNMTEFQEILRVTSSPIFGKPKNKGYLLLQGRDPLSQALLATKDNGWETQEIIDRAYEVVTDSDDISLVGLAIHLKDPIAIAALRESVILYAEAMEMGIYRGPKIEYVWKVDADFAKSANQFIEEFNSLLPKDSYLSNGIPKAEHQNANRFYSKFARNEFPGRCANLGFDRSFPRQFYHWAITKQYNELALDEFWDTKLWTTQNYRSKQEQLGWKFLKNELTK